jgi:hypothetical protein
MVFNTTFNNISVLSWRSVLLVEETGVPGENLSQSLTNFTTYCCIKFQTCIVCLYKYTFSFSFSHCVVCSFSIYGFWLLLWYLQSLLKRFLFCLFCQNRLIQMYSDRIKFFNWPVHFCIELWKQSLIKVWSQFLLGPWRNNLNQVLHTMWRVTQGCVQPDWGYFDQSL